MPTLVALCEWPDCYRRSGRSAFCPLHRPYCAHVGANGTACRARAADHRRYCWRHAQRPGAPNAPGRQPKHHRRQPATCTVDGCDRAPCVARGLCARHYRRWRRTGSVADPYPDSGACRYCAERALPDGLCRVHSARAASGDPLMPRYRVNLGRVCAEGDGRPAHKLGLCTAHYLRRWHALHRANLALLENGT